MALAKAATPVLNRAKRDWYAFLERPRLPSPDEASLEAFRGKSILVTGAAGSIGSALSLRLGSLKPKSLILLDASEHSLHRLQSRIHAEELPMRPNLQLGNVADSRLMSEIIAIHKPQIVLHAAAYKQVPLLEHHPLEAIANNARNTFSLSELCRQNSVPRFVLLSTDKAVAPISILGATKRIAERVTLANGGVVMRLGNVLGTEGSVSETFVQQIADGGPITLTDPEAQRYFLTSDEAVDLLLAAADNTPGGAADGSLLVPALDRQYSIASLAEFLMTSAKGIAPIAIHRIAPRPGDKPSEALWSGTEHPASGKKRSYIELAQGAVSRPRIDDLEAAVTSRNLRRAVELVRELVPDYAPSETVLRLLQHPASGATQR